MANSKRKAKNKKHRIGTVGLQGASNLPGNVLDDLRQLLYPPEWRISMRAIAAQVYTQEGEIPPPVPEAPKDQPPRDEDNMLAEVATCLWYLKTKHFRRKWNDQDSNDEDPRVRRGLGRLNKGIDALSRGGIEVQDPTDMRYPVGGEALMRPLDFIATEGLTYERVTETVVPIVFTGNRLIQRAEVFVAVPPTPPSVKETSAIPTTALIGLPPVGEPTQQATPNAEAANQSDGADKNTISQVTTLTNKTPEPKGN